MLYIFKMFLVDYFMKLGHILKAIVRTKYWQLENASPSFFHAHEKQWWVKIVSVGLWYRESTRFCSTGWVAACSSWALMLRLQDLSSPVSRAEVFQCPAGSPVRTVVMSSSGALCPIYCSFSQSASGHLFHLELNNPCTQQEQMSSLDNPFLMSLAIS